MGVEGWEGVGRKGMGGGWTGGKGGDVGGGSRGR